MKNNILKILVFPFVIALLGSAFVSFSEAGSNLTLEKITDCNIQYMGDTCVVKMKATNNAGEVLTGEGVFLVEYENQLFDGEGIYPSFLPNNASSGWLNPSQWQNGEVSFVGFDISEGETFMNLEIKTHMALMPGQYNFIFTLKGVGEDGEEETATIPAGGNGGGGGGGVVSQELSIRDDSVVTSNKQTTSIVVSWYTNNRSTSRVIYGTDPGVFDSTNTPNYGYAFSTDVFNTPASENGVNQHSVTLVGLLPNTTYYFRAVSTASPPKFSSEYNFVTLVPGAEASIENKSEIPVGGDNEGSNTNSFYNTNTANDYSTNNSKEDDDSILPGSTENNYNDNNDSRESSGQEAGLIFGFIPQNWLIYISLFVLILIIFAIIFFIKKKKQRNNLN
ncbi:MAG: fibronectin type III domain-containing protein [Candidatus Marinimicrobia bacterium]|nr:fibronectin type III domain-containing protein [Candidatus Neomarinimicrobiota bacterium]